MGDGQAPIAGAGERQPPISLLAITSDGTGIIAITPDAAEIHALGAKAAVSHCKVDAVSRHVINVLNDGVNVFVQVARGTPSTATAVDADGRQRTWLLQVGNRGQGDQQGLLSRSAVANRLGVSVKTVDRLVTAEKLKPTRVGDRVLFDPAELDRYLREN